jgi:hypothetical protein
MASWYELVPVDTDYTTARQAEDSFRDGKDWLLATPIGRTRCSIRDFKTGDMIELRFNKPNLDGITVVEV